MSVPKNNKRPRVEEDPYVFAKRSRSENATERKQLLDDEEAEIKKEQDAVAALLAAQKSARVFSPTPGTRNDGQFHLTFVQMGQGDCIIMATPQGSVIVVDCGTNSKEQGNIAFKRRVQPIVNSAKFLKNDKNIDVLVLTHPDSDHYDQLATVFGMNQVKVGAVYHIFSIGDYRSGAQWVRKHVAHERFIYKAVHNKDGGIGAITLEGNDVPAGGAGAKVGQLDAGGGIRILDEPDCKVAILAADVYLDYAKDNDGADHKNRGSIVLLIEVFGKKVLLCGDATRSTEHYLLKVRNDSRLSEVDIVHVAHHGSDLTSSGIDFVQKVNPKLMAVISAGKKGVVSHHLPSWKVVDRYVAQFAAAGRAKVAKHVTLAYDTGLSLYLSQPKEQEYPVYVTGSAYTIPISWEKPA
jgi:beta-lactamase superfamily II metal-dependent hydrolase